VRATVHETIGVVDARASVRRSSPSLTIVIALRGASLAGEDDRVLGCAPDVTTAPSSSRSNTPGARTVPRPHAGVAVDLDLQRHGS
jgi:hypothetical protein